MRANATDAERVLLTHGDLLCDDDNYLRYRRRVRGRLFRAFAAILPLSLRRHLAARMRAGSQRRRQAAAVSRVRRRRQCANGSVQCWFMDTRITLALKNGAMRVVCFAAAVCPIGKNAPGYVLLKADGTMTEHAVAEADEFAQKRQ